MLQYIADLLLVGGVFPYLPIVKEYLLVYDLCAVESINDSLGVKDYIHLPLEVTIFGDRIQS